MTLASWTWTTSDAADDKTHVAHFGLSFIRCWETVKDGSKRLGREGFWLVVIVGFGGGAWSVGGSAEKEEEWRRLRKKKLSLKVALPSKTCRSTKLRCSPQSWRRGQLRGQLNCIEPRLGTSRPEIEIVGPLHSRIRTGRVLAGFSVASTRAACLLGWRVPTHRHPSHSTKRQVPYTV